MAAQGEPVPLRNVQDSAHWRVKASEARSLAEMETNPNIKQKLIVAAESCDRMAALLERAPKIRQEA